MRSGDLIGRLVRRTAFLSILVAGTIACSGKSSGLVLEFPPGTQDDAGTLSLYVLHPLSGEDLCTILQRPVAPVLPTSPDLVRDATIEDVTVDEFLTGAGRTLEGLPSGDKIFFVTVEDAAGAPFLRGCIAASLEGGASIVLPLVLIDGDPDPDAMPMTPDAPIDAPPDVPPNLTVLVLSASNPSQVVPFARVVIDDGGAGRDEMANAAGHATFTDVSGLLSPYDITVVGEIAGTPTYRAAATLINIAPDLDATGNYQMTIPLEIGPPVSSGTGSISGNVTGLATGAQPESGEIHARTELLRPPAQVLAADGPYAFMNLAPDTWSVAFLVKNTAGQVVRLLVNLGPAVGAGALTLSYNAALAVPLNLPVTATLVTPGALALVPRVLGLDVLLARGPINLAKVDNPTSPVTMMAPDVAALAGAALLYRYEATDAAARVTSQAQAAVIPAGVTLQLQSPPTITSPPSGSLMTEASAQALELGWSGVFSQHNFVHVRMIGVGPSTTYSWNLVAPRATGAVSLPLPPLPDLRLLVSGVTYDLTITGSSMSGSPAYAPNVAKNYQTWTRAFDAPLRSSKTITFTVMD